LDCNLLLGCGIGPSASPSDPLKPAWPTLLPEHDYVPIDQSNTNGLIVALPLHSQSRSEYIQSLINAAYPVLFIGSGENGPAIVADNVGGILEAMQHLYEHGHRKIAFIAGSDDDSHGDSGDRLRAYHQFHENNNLNKNPGLIAYGQHIYSGGVRAMQEILALGAEFTAVMASNDESALGAINALNAAGLKVPEDVAVIGFDNRLEGAVHEPGLSSIHVPLFDIGYRAVELLLKNIRGETPITETTKVETRLISRQSCGCGQEQSQIAIKSGQASELAEGVIQAVMNQAHSLTQDEANSLGKQLVDSFLSGTQSGEWTAFQDVLDQALKRTAKRDDDCHLWQEAISILENWANAQGADYSASTKSILDKSRQTISAQMQQQHRRYVMQEQWTSSRLSLLTAELLTALDETQIYKILETHLPEMNILTSVLVLFEADEDDPLAWSNAHNVLSADNNPIKFTSREFPPKELLSEIEPFRLTLIPLVDQSGQLGYMAFDTDFLHLYGTIVQQVGSALNTVRLYRQATEGRRLAEEANHMKSRFLSTISHELRTPLNLIVGLSSILLREGEDAQSDLSEATEKDIQRIYAYAQHLGGLIGDVIDLATLDAGQLRLNKELIDLGETLQMVVESGSQLTADKGLEWQSDIPNKGPWIWGDRTRLRQVVLNLVNNAIKFTSQGGVILSSQLNEEFVTISVKDTGLGIPPQEQDVIFDAFRRSERSMVLGYSGLGLGLAICKMLVEMHGGTLSLRSSGIEGEGSEFSLTLPIEMAFQSTIEQDDEQPARESYVLMLSSQTETHTRLPSLLNQHGMNVREVVIKNALEWDTEIEVDVPDAIILDASDKTDLTWKAFKSVKENQLFRTAPTFIYAASEGGESLINLNYITKPVDVEDLTLALDQHWGVDNAESSARTILVVDDEPDTLELHARIVQSQSSSNRVLLASNGVKALELIQQEQIDLILLDLQMPGMDGFGLLEKMRAEKNMREIPVIVVTGKVLTKDDMERLNQGVAVVLQKGLFSSNETVAHIEATLERKRNLGADTQRLVRQAMAYIHEHYSEPVSRQDIARHINVSEDYLTFCFRQELGTTPIKYLQRYRVNRAKSLLKDTQKTITEIALEVGFSEGGYFSRIFHRETGMPPDQFRRSG